MRHFEYHRAADERDAIDKVSSEPGASYLAGGTNLIDLMKYNIATPSALVDLGNVAAHRGIEMLDNGGCRLSAFATNADTAYHPLIEEKYPVLSKAILAGASPQIRNMATNGGNLLQRTRCYYFFDAHMPCNKRIPGSGCPAKEGYNRMMAILGASEACIATFPSDMCVALAALDATINVQGADGDRQIPIVDFHRLPGDTPHLDNNLRGGELITSVDLPEKGFNQHYSYLKVRDRNSYAFALVSVATCLELENGLITDARLALGGVAHKPWRNLEAEACLLGKEPSEATFAEAADIILAEAVGYEHNAFKIGLAKKAIIRNGMMALQPETQLPGARPSL